MPKTISVTPCSEALAKRVFKAVIADSAPSPAYLLNVLNFL